MKTAWECMKQMERDVIVGPLLEGEQSDITDIIAVRDAEYETIVLDVLYELLGDPDVSEEDIFTAIKSLREDK